ncbi:MAG: guanylate kinase [Bacilli bacterium]|nr:guanylate kinase [Bacilli bacterium]
MIVLVGASASGKTEIAKALANRFGIKKAVTHTSRPMRVNEKNDVDYHFVSDEEFLKLKAEDAFVETTFYNNHYYGCSKAEIGDDKCVVVDPNGLRSFRALNNDRIVAFYLRATKQTRFNRMTSRLDKPELIASRLANDDVSFAEENLPKMDFVIDTDEKTIEELTSMVYRLYSEKLNLL